MPMTADELLDHVRDPPVAPPPDGRDRDRGGRPQWAGGPACRRGVNEFWTSRQRAAHSLHEIFLPRLLQAATASLLHSTGSPRPGAVGLRPVCGQGDDAPRGRPRGPGAVRLRHQTRSAGCCWRPRLSPPVVDEVRERLTEIDLGHSRPDGRMDLEVFLSRRDTLVEIAALRHYLHDRERAGTMDGVDRWIRMVTVNRLDGPLAGIPVRLHAAPKPGDHGSPTSARSTQRRGTGAARGRDLRENRG